MSKLKWKRAKINNSGTANLLDEKDLRARDPAALWLKGMEPQKPEPKLKAKSSRHPQSRREDLRAGPADARPGLIVYTDGACEPNPGKGGWAFVAYRDGVEIYSECGGEMKTTNNIMEMTGVMMALEWLLASPDRQFAKILSDSQYVVKGCNDWRFAWKSRGWRRVVDKKARKMEPIKNADLWKGLDALLVVAPAKIEWVKGHVGILGNERADELSQAGRKKAIAAGGRGYIAAADEVDPLILEQLHYVI